MAAELVAGALLSSFLSIWFDRLASHDQVKDFIRGQKTTQGLLQKLEIKLLSVNKVLDDAEEKQIRTVRKWLDELKDVVYAAGDVLDEINTEALRHKLEVDQSGSSSTCCQVPNFIYSTWFNKYERNLERRIVEILDKLQFIADQKDVVGLKQLHIHSSALTPFKSSSGPDSSNTRFSYATDHQNNAVHCSLKIEKPGLEVVRSIIGLCHPYTGSCFLEGQGMLAVSFQWVQILVSNMYTCELFQF